MKLLQLSIYNYQLSMNEQFSFINVATWQMVSAKSMLNVKCQMINASEGGV